MTEHDSNADDGRERTENDRIERLERTVETLAERVVELETERAGSGGAGTASDGGGVVSRRSVLGALGLAGLAGLGATTASADPQGQIGTSSDPLRTLNVESINTGLASTQFELSVGGSRALLLGQEEQTQSLAGPVVLGHSNNSATGAGATISGGGRGGAPNEAGRNATVSGGNDNGATANAATICGGFGNEASGRQAAIGGGTSQTASALQATIAGGRGNTASGEGAAVGGGAINEASGDYAIVPGGEANSAAAPHSFAGGTNASATHEGAFIWSDTSSGGLTTLNPNEFAVLASGGTFFFSNAGATTGVELSSGSGSWSSASSRTLKSDVDPVDGPDVLDRVEDLEISTWSYDSENEGVRHMGPMAEEFYEAFELGDDEEQISNVDADGVALAAIQGLAERHDVTADRVEETVDRVEKTADRVEATGDRLDATEADLAETEERVGETSERLDETDERVAALEAENEALREELTALRAEVEFVENAMVADDAGPSATATAAGRAPKDAEESG
jgi:hypothetical protein